VFEVIDFEDLQFVIDDNIRMSACHRCTEHNVEISHRASDRCVSRLMEKSRAYVVQAPVQIVKHDFNRGDSLIRPPRENRRVTQGCV
jgi:hypothetical protein